MIGDLHRRGDMHRGRERIVGGLAEIDMIVRMHRLLRAANATQQFTRAIPDHLVQIHVGLGAGAGLPDDQREMPVELPLDDFIGSGRDRIRQLRLDQLQLEIGERCRFFHHGEGPDQGLRHGFLADSEIPQRPLGLRAPIAVLSHLDRTERVRLGAHRFFPRFGFVCLSHAQHLACRVNSVKRQLGAGPYRKRPKWAMMSGSGRCAKGAAPLAFLRNSSQTLGHSSDHGICHDGVTPSPA